LKRELSEIYLSRRSCNDRAFLVNVYGVYVIWDRKLDFLKEVLVAPVSRASIFAGKVLGGCTDVMIQVIVLLIIGSFIVMPLQALVL